MANLDDAALVAALRVAYERGRLRVAVVRSSPLLALIGIAVALAGPRSVPLLAGVPLLALAVAMHWKSAQHGRAVLPGVAFGLIPLMAMRAAQSFGHVCVAGACYAVCIPACVASGVVAGALLGRFGHRAQTPLSAFTGATALAFLTGALSCACVGVAGLIGLAFGVALGTAPVVLGHALSKKTS